MCRHKWVDINEVSVCQLCGLTLEKKTGKFIMFDRAIINAGSKKRSKKK